MKRKIYRRKRQYQKLHVPYFSWSDLFDLDTTFARYIAAGIAQYLLLGVSSIPSEIYEQALKDAKTMHPTAGEREQERLADANGYATWISYLQEMQYAFDQLSRGLPDSPDMCWSMQYGNYDQVKLIPGTNRLDFSKVRKTPRDILQQEDAYQTRIQHGCDLFHQYFHSLWN